ncbi:MAG: tRNA uridine-5-carboxymethylaminomethyl(34) synthesis GTPase MnmE [Lachnospiraceae bacterium]|jgi:tRNA modification GTPase TrmE|nr:tRNA uridine-5-carboxymethylaminomethyl(34) synthesis GTPase MnmE [Lachnospiraceae bacterium]
MKGDTIAAIASAITNSGIGIVRISGQESLSIIDQIYQSKNGNKKLSEVTSHTIHYGYICDQGKVIDEVMVLIMRAPNSYTTEDTVEIDCHGGSLVMKRILETVIKYGARPAEAGEFTKRAFLNGRIDLSQAESVMDLIQAKNDISLESSIYQLQGNLKKKVNKIRKELIHEIAFIESALDDPEHITLDGYNLKLNDIIKNLTFELNELLRLSENGELLKEGINTVIIGKPNAGKSSLLNLLAGRERAIVTEVEGTTRDVLQEQINLNGIILNLIDTAGIRETDDIVEKIGVDKAKKYLLDADLIIYMVDSSTTLDKNDHEILDLLRNRKVIILLNKCDLQQLTSEMEVKKAFIQEEDLDFNHRQEHLESDQEISSIKEFPIISFSAKEQIGVEKLQTLIQEMFFAGEIEANEEIFLINVRQKAALESALNSLSLVKRSIEDQMPEDFYSIDLMSAYEELGTITGETVGEDLVNEIFSKFCMGK